MSPARRRRPRGLTLLLALLWASPLAARQATAEPALDVLVIVADDLGWSDVFPHVATPNLESLARSGVTFRRAYSMPICTPSRHAMMFGRYGRRDGVLGGARHIRAAEAPLAPGPLALAELLRTRGWATAAFGKWHLDAPTHPLEDLTRPEGFETFRAGTRGNLGKDPRGYERWLRIDDGRETASSTYATLAVRDAFLAWWRGQEGPRFAWLAFHAPHQPFHEPPAELLPAEGARAHPTNTTERRTRYEAAVRALDRVLGDVLAELDLARTLVVFVADNGTPPRANSAAQDPLRMKGSVFETGVHVPLIVAGPGVRAGAESGALVHVVDLMASVAEVLRVPLPEGVAVDSRSFAPLLAEPSGPGARRTVFFEIRNAEDPEDGTSDEEGVRSATHKLRVVHGPEGAREELYDLRRDPGERRPLDGTLPESRAVLAELRGVLRALPPRLE
jgi:arylsulfatase A-like enzyme